MLLYSASIFTLLMIFSELILALPKTNYLEDRSDSSAILSKQGNLFSRGSNIDFFSTIRKRLLHRSKKIVKPGVKCDGTFYKDSKVDAIANKACQESFGRTGFAPPKSAISRMLTHPQKPFTDSHNLFPKEADHLTMMPITNIFFLTHMVAGILRQRKEDYVVFANECRVVGIVRRVSGDDFTICSRTENVP